MTTRTVRTFLALSIAALALLAAPARAAGRPPGGSGTLQAVDREGRALGTCPLEHTDVAVEVSGFVARVAVTQFPMGAESAFKGVVDLLEQKAITFGDGDVEEIKEGPIPEEYKADVTRVRNELIERIAETDDDLTVKYLDGKEITKEELKKALRKACIAGKLIPIVCGTALSTGLLKLPTLKPQT